MNTRQEILALLRGQQIGKIPVSLYKIDPYDEKSFWAGHASFSHLLEKMRSSCHNFYFFRPNTGFFFSDPSTIEVKEERKQDSRISEVITLTVETEKGLLTRTARTTKLSNQQWVLKPWITTSHDIEKFLSLPYTPCKIDLRNFFEKESAYGDKSMPLISLPDPTGVIGFLFAPGDLPKFLLDHEKLVTQLFEIFVERLENIYRDISTLVHNVIIRIRGAEYLTPPILPIEYFRNYKDVFINYVIKPDAKLINILRSGNLNYVCYHWHDIREDLLPYVLRLGIDILEPVITTIEVPMTIAKIRKITGPNITLMGGPAIEDIEFRSSYEIAELCRDSIVQNGRSTKFVLIPSDVPSSIPLSPQTEENLLAMINTANNFTAII
ncbi:MAG TPA: hypothetical protein P5065_05015 [Candidatus Ratteibacteria bacterium]|jgi:hypothetical protein|nr:hypothetical protein [bacterium]HRS06383.1 hypothetical protein [Candidatus Ratteibacteria bacterium]HRV04621.1 hypothetical protein [Candidatus Ratteibacteria bacterium]